MFRFINKLWPTFLFTFICLAFLEHGHHNIQKDYDKLHITLLKLLAAKQSAYEQQQRLLLQINGESDPAWVELLLMKNLGVIPEGSMKVFFSDD